MAENQNLFLGIDGGATKSTFVLINEKEEKTLKEIDGPLNLRIIGEKKFKKNILSIFKKINHSYRKRIKYACFGLAGVDSKKDKDLAEEKILKIGAKYLSFPFFVVNDIEIISPSIGINEGVIAICGTGSNFFAKKKDREIFAGGLDYILSDEGSAFYIGQKILHAAVKSFDGRGEKTIFEKIVFREAKIKDGNIKSLVNFVYKERPKNIVASFAPFLEEGIEKKDKVAFSILNETICEILNGIFAVAKRAGFKNNFLIGLSGSVFHNKFLVDKLMRRLRNTYKNIRVLVVPEPEVGAARLAKEKYLQSLNKKSLKNKKNAKYR